MELRGRVSYTVIEEPPHQPRYHKLVQELLIEQNFAVLTTEVLLLIHVLRSPAIKFDPSVRCRVSLKDFVKADYERVPSHKGHVENREQAIKLYQINVKVLASPRDVKN